MPQVQKPLCLKTYGESPFLIFLPLGQYRARQKNSSKGARILFLLLLTTSAWPCLKNSRNRNHSFAGPCTLIEPTIILTAAVLLDGLKVHSKNEIFCNSNLNLINFVLVYARRSENRQRWCMHKLQSCNWRCISHCLQPLSENWQDHLVRSKSKSHVFLITSWKEGLASFHSPLKENRREEPYACGMYQPSTRSFHPMRRRRRNVRHNSFVASYTAYIAF